MTALVERPRGRVAVEVDGERWRELPVAVVARVGLRVGALLDRPRLRELRRELRRAEALGAAARALSRRDLSTHGLEERLERAGVAASDRAEAVETLARAGYVDDARFAAGRAEQLAGRGFGDAAIAADLDRQGVSAEVAADALAALEPERERARRLVERRGASPRTASYLLRRGFEADAVEVAVADGGTSE